MRAVTVVKGSPGPLPPALPSPLFVCQWPTTKRICLHKNRRIKKEKNKKKEKRKESAVQFAAVFARPLFSRNLGAELFVQVLVAGLSCACENLKRIKKTKSTWAQVYFFIFLCANSPLRRHQSAPQKSRANGNSGKLRWKCPSSWPQPSDASSTK